MENRKNLELRILIISWSSMCSFVTLAMEPERGLMGIPRSAYAACVGRGKGDPVTDGKKSGTCQLAHNGILALRQGDLPTGIAAPESKVK